MEKQEIKYEPNIIEPRWQKYWEEKKIYSPDLDLPAGRQGSATKPFGTPQGKPFYNLMMFPYPSAEGLHVGNMYAFTGSDIYGRFQQMRGFDVFEPIGLDGFGIHSENYALKIGKNPMDQAKISQENFYRQLRLTGNAYDWSRTVETYDQNYYKWTQWIFVQMFKNGLAVRKKAAVNFCPSCKTVLSDEQVIDGKCERCGTTAEKRNLEQWFFKITEYAERLLNNLEKLNWSEKVKIAQRNWIGRSEGALIEFKLASKREESGENSDIANYEIEVFTTRPDTLYGATFMVLSPENPLVKEILLRHLADQDDRKKKIEEYIESAKKKTEQERIAAGRDPSTGSGLGKTGVFTGLYAVNPVNNAEIPIWIADYVLMGYGTGAIMAVPAHDERDFEFAKKYDLPIVQVIAKRNIPIRSYLMGADRISDQELINLKIKISEKTAEGNRKIEILKESIPSYEKIIKEKITPGFWNEYIGEEVVFIFKHKDGRVERIVLNLKTEDKIDRMAAEFNGENWKKKNVWKWLAENDWYKPLIIHEDEGEIVNSGNWNGLQVPQDLNKVISYLQEKGLGKKEVHYHLRDWLISRQRYWGAPIPMIYCETCAKAGKSWFTNIEAKKNPESRIQNSEFRINWKLEIGNSTHEMAGWPARHTSQPRLQKPVTGGQVAGVAGWYPVSEDQLPVKLPYIKDFKPLGIHSTGSGQAVKSPLANHPDFYNVACPECGEAARRETDVSDTFLDSAWYFFRYIGTEFDSVPFPSSKFIIHNSEFIIQKGSKKNLTEKNIKRLESWLPVNMYIGGAEHAVLHLLYSRFMTMFFYDLGLIDFEEPYKRFYAHGLLIKEGAKMSKSKGNIINPDEYIQKYGSDTLRMYLMFLGPFSQGGDFYDSGIEGMYKFVQRVWRLFAEPRGRKTQNHAEKGVGVVPRTVPQGSALIMMHKTIKKVTEDIENLRYNTAISAMMEWYNYINEKLKIKNEKLSEEETVTFLKLLAPFAPFMTEELYQRFKNYDLRFMNGEADTEKGNYKSHIVNHKSFSSIHLSPWPVYDEKYLQEDFVTIVIQVNGKRRGEIRIRNTECRIQDKVEEGAKEKIQKYLEGKEIRKVVYIPGKIVNFVV